MAGTVLFRRTVRDTGLRALAAAGAALLAGLACVFPSIARESEDTRRVDVSSPPWTAVGQVNNTAYGRCTGILLGPRQALTAAHCLYNRGTQRFLPPEAVHFVLGYDRGSFAFHTVAASIRIGDGYEPQKPMESIGHDWALLDLKESIPETTLPIAWTPERPETGTPLSSAGFGQSRLYALTVTSPCPVLGHGPEDTIAVGCAIQHGYSGGPLLDPQNRLVGIQVAGGKANGRDFALAVPASAWASALAHP